MKDPLQFERETTRRLFDEALAVTWSPERQIVANVFNAYYTRAFKIEDIEGIARIADGLAPNASLKKALSAFVRSKVLRRNGKLYEVNF